MPDTAQQAATKRLRIVQWATGTVGKSALCAVLDAPDLDLVGVKVYSDSKAGLTAGEIAGRSPGGPVATRDLAEILALKPDCLVYMPESTHIDDVCAILDSGINIVSTRAEFFNPTRMEPGMRERIEAACRKGSSSIHSTGSSPGFITEALPLVLLSLERHLDLLTIDEFANCIDGCSEEMLLGIMGFGQSPEAFGQHVIPDRDVVFQHSLTALADAIGMPIDGFEAESEIALARKPTKLHHRTIEAGTVAGQRHTVTALSGGKPLLRFRSNWFVTTDLDPGWELREDGWRVTVEGDAPLDITIGFPIPDDPIKRQLTLPRLTANPPVNAIRAVCMAPPGIITNANLPKIVPKLRRPAVAPQGL